MERNDPPDAAELAELIVRWIGLSMRLDRRSRAGIQALAQVGMTLQQMAALHLLMFEGPVSVSELTDKLGLSVSATSHLVQRLVEQGLVTRDESETDRRTKVIALTPAGKKLVEKMMKTRIDEMRSSVRHLSDAVRRELGPVLRRIVDELAAKAKEALDDVAPPVSSHGRTRDMRGEDLEGADLRGQNLAGARFDGTSLEGADLRDANLSGARFDGSSVEGANFAGAKLDGARFEGANCEGADFSSANLHGARFDGASVEGATFDDANLSAARFEGCGCEGASYRSANLADARFDGASVDGAVFEGANVRSARFDGASCEGASFARADVADARFDGAGLDGASFKDAKNLSPDVASEYGIETEE